MALQKMPRANWLAFVLLAGWLAYYLADLLGTGFISDDAYNSQIKGALIQDGISIYQRTYNEILGWIKGAGRFFPLAWYIYPLYYVTQDIFVIKLLTLLIVIVGVVLFAVFVRNETGSLRAGLLAGMAMPIFFQFRLWHDPILGFTFLIPIIFVYMMGALVLYQKHLDGRKGYWLHGAILLYLLALLTYEITYPLAMLFVILAYSRHRDVRQALRLSAPFVSLAVVFILLMVLLRLLFLNEHPGLAQSTYPGAQLYADGAKVMQAFKVQTFASIPLSYFFNKNVALDLQFYKSDLLLIGAFFVALCFALIGLVGKQMPTRLGGLLLLGVVLMFLPALVISLSGHQQELIQIGYGFGYIPVYFQYFGLCLIGLTALIHIFNSVSGRYAYVIAIAFAAIFSSVAAINLGTNRAVAEETNKFFKYPRVMLGSALDAGVLDGVPENSLLLRTMRFPSDWTWFYTSVTGKKFNLCSLDEITAYKDCIAKLAVAHPASVAATGTVEKLDTRDLNVWILSYGFDKEHGRRGQLVLGKVDYLVQDSATKKPIQIAVRRLKVYQLESGKIDYIEAENRPVNFLKIIENEGGRLLSTDALLSPDNAVAPTAFQWSGGVFERDGTDASNVRWSSGRGTLALYNLSEKPQTIRLVMELAAPADEQSQLLIRYEKHVDALKLSGGLLPYLKTIALPPGETRISFVSDGKPIPNGDPRQIVFGIYNFRLDQVSAGSVAR